jgi:hypothetical protein
MEDTIVLFETLESFTQNMKPILDAVAWLKAQRPEIEVKIVILPDGAKRWREN